MNDSPILISFIRIGSNRVGKGLVHSIKTNFFLYMRKKMKGVFGLVLATIVGLLAVVIIAVPTTEASTTTGTTTGSFTSSGAGAGDVTLTSAHWRASTTDMSVSCTPSGGSASDVTSGATLNSARTVVSLSSLTASTAYSCTVTYLAEISDSTVGIVLKIVPFLLLIGSISASFGGAYLGVKGGMGSGSGAGALKEIVPLLVAIILIPVVISFADLVGTTYGDLPSFIGIQAVLPLITISYVLGILGSSFQAVAPRVRSVMR